MRFARVAWLGTYEQRPGRERQGDREAPKLRRTAVDPLPLEPSGLISGRRRFPPVATISALWGLSRRGFRRVDDRIAVTKRLLQRAQLGAAGPAPKDRRSALLSTLPDFP